MSWLQILTGDCRSILPTLEPGSMQCCVTSPPYWGLRDYGTAQWEGGEAECRHIESTYPGTRDGLAKLSERMDGRPRGDWESSKALERAFKDVCGHCGARRIDSQLGLEATPEEYIANMVAVFREVWRVLRDDGTLWINLGDSYAGSWGAQSKRESEGIAAINLNRFGNGKSLTRKPKTFGLKPKDLCMMPARLAMALQADGWYLRSEIVWHKPNPMPESVTDRPTKAHEMIYLLAKQERYFYDAEAIREGAIADNREFFRGNDKYTSGNSFLNNSERSANGKGHVENPSNLRNKRTVWTIATQPYAEAHFATFPEEIPKLCILAGSKPGDTVLDPFAGSGTVGQVALELGRRAVLIELNPAYVELAHDRTNVTPGFF
jgi:DNA modification methylase